MTKVAAKTDRRRARRDLALNAWQVTRRAGQLREPVVWAGGGRGGLQPRTRPSWSWLAPLITAGWRQITLLLMLGGAFPGASRALRSRALRIPALEGGGRGRAPRDPGGGGRPNVDLVAYEKQEEKIKGGCAPDFILSAEIVVIALGTVAAALRAQPARTVLVGISLVMTVGVYGLVARHRRQARRPRPALQRSARLSPAASAAPSRCTVADEDAVGGRHRGDVHGRRRHPAARLADSSCTRWSISPRDSAAWRRIDQQHRRGRGVGIVAGAIVLAAVMVVQKLRRTH